MQTELVETVEQSVVPVTPIDQGSLVGMDPLLRLAAGGVPIDTIKELVQLYREERVLRAREEFAQAFAAFKADCPIIKKNRTADFVTKAGGRVKYTFADLAEIARTVRPNLQRHGLSYSWTRAVQGSLMSVTCKLLHARGHAEVAEFSVPVEGTSMMSEPQKYKAALSFAERVSLCMVLGLADSDDDDDMHPEAGAEPISEVQVLELEALISETKTNRQKFLAYAGVERLEDLMSTRFDWAKSALAKKRSGHAAS